MFNVAIFADGEVGQNCLRSFQNHKLLPTIIILKNNSDLDVEYFKSLGVKICELNARKSNWQIIENSLLNLHINLSILAYWPWIIPKSTLSIPTVATINLHLSYLPFNRGKSPNFWPIVDGSPAGVSIHVANEIIDGGPILFQKLVSVEPDDTGQTLHKKLVIAMDKLFNEKLLNILNGNFLLTSQNISDGTFHSSAEFHAKSELKLDGRQELIDFYNLIRAKTHDLSKGLKINYLGKSSYVKFDFSQESNE